MWGFVCASSRTETQKEKNMYSKMKNRYLSNEGIPGFGKNTPVMYLHLNPVLISHLSYVMWLKLEDEYRLRFGS